MAMTHKDGLLSATGVGVSVSRLVSILMRSESFEKVGHKKGIEEI